MVLRQNTSVPIPEIYAASATNDNSVGVPYILMEYIHGTVANGFEYDGMGGPGNPEQHAHLLKQMAQIMVQLASIRFDKIGSIFQNDETEEFYIGPELETGKGPFSTAQEYYNAVSSHRLDCYIKTCFETNLKVDEDRGVTLPLVFNHLMPFFTNSDTDTGPFYLTNADFGFHNVLIDADFNIQGVIDCDDCLSAPLHVAAQLPSLSGLDPHPPGMETKKPLAIKFGKVTALDIERFVKMVAEAELSLQGENLKTSLADTMQSDGFYMWQGLDWYNSHCGWVNTERLQSFWYMYFRRIKGMSYKADY